MGTLRTLRRKNYWISNALLVAMLLWIGGGPALSPLDHSTSAPTKSRINPASDAEDGTNDQESDRSVLSSLEAMVAPVAKLQVPLLNGFVPPCLVHKTIAPARVAPLTPPNNYLRTLFRIITPANAP